jgi:hypothetical protein
VAQALPVRGHRPALPLRAPGGQGRRDRGEREGLPGEALAAFPFRVTHVLTDRGSCFTAEGFERPAARSASSTARPGPTRRGRTGWSSASTAGCSARCSASRWPATATWSGCWPASTPPTTPVGSACWTGARPRRSSASG